MSPDALNSFADIPEEIRRRLAAGERVALILLDAFGREFLQRHDDHPLVRRLRVTPLRAQFPSTTTAHVTTAHFGVPVGTHGLYEWNILEPSVDRLICPLRFNLAGSDTPEDLADRLDPAVLAPGPTFYLWTELDELSQTATVLLTADHGQVDVPPDRVDYLDDLWPALPALLSQSRPAGSSRDIFLHAPAENVDDVLAGLTERLGDRARVLPAAELFDAIGPRLRERLGDVASCPRLAARSGCGPQRPTNAGFAGSTVALIPWRPAPTWRRSCRSSPRPAGVRSWTTGACRTEGSLGRGGWTEPRAYLIPHAARQSSECRKAR